VAAGGTKTEQSVFDSVVGAAILSLQCSALGLLIPSLTRFLASRQAHSFSPQTGSIKR